MIASIGSQSCILIVTDDISVLHFCGVISEFQHLINEEYMTIPVNCTDFQIAKVLGVKSTDWVEQIGMSTGCVN